MTRPHLAVFFTRGMSLEGWHRAGILARELALYRALAGDLSGVTFVTYGGPADGKWVSDLNGIEVLPNRWQLPGNLYSLLAPFLHWRKLRSASFFRTTQINGAWTGLIAKVVLRKPLVVRGGYLWADVVARQGAHRIRRTVARVLESLVIRSADRVVVAGEADAASVARYGAGISNRVVVVPNYVDFSLFRLNPAVVHEQGRILFVGRLEFQKNVEALIEAVQRLNGATLTIVGDGSLRSRLESQARAGSGRVEFVGRLPQERLPELLWRSEIFVLPSRWEGNPKALFEAMACGVPVVGARVPGIQEVLADGVTGVTCGTSSADIRAALERLLHDAPLRERLRTAALAWVQERRSFAVAVARERALLESLAGGVTC